MTHIRAAKLSDVSLILEFIHQKADFDRTMGAFEPVLKATEARLHTTLFGRTPFAHVLFAEQEEQAVGFALYYFRYSSFAAQPSLWLDDLYISEKSRSQGIGAMLMVRVAQEALAADCSHMAWTANVHNRGGQRFYDRLGATVTEQHGDVLYYRLDGVAIRIVAADITTAGS